MSVLGLPIRAVLVSSLREAHQRSSLTAVFCFRKQSSPSGHVPSQIASLGTYVVVKCTLHPAHGAQTQYAERVRTAEGFRVHASVIAEF